MKKEDIQIEVEPRVPGRVGNVNLRKEHLVPGVVYSPKAGSHTLSAAQKNLRKYLSHEYENTIFTLKSKDSKLNNLKVLFKQKDIHPVSRTLTHFDFYAVDLTQKIKVRVELKFTGKAAGITEGGLFQAIARDVEVECLPDAIPTHIEIDVSPLGVHESLHVSDLKVGDGVRIVTDGSVTICTVTIVQEEVAAPVVAAPGAEGAAAAAAEPEVIGKGKKKEGEEGAEGAPAAGGAKPAAAAAPKADKK